MVWPYDEVYALLNALNTYGNQLYNWLGGNIYGLLGQTQNYANTLAYTLQNNANFYLNNSLEFNKGLLTQTNGTIQSAINSANQVYSYQQQRIGDEANYAFGQVQALANVASQATFSAAQNAFNQSENIMNRTVDAVQNHAANSLDIVGAAADAVIGGVFGSINSAIQDSRQLQNEAWAQLRANVQQLQGNSTVAFQNITSQATALTQAGLANIGGFANYVANQATGYTQTLVNSALGLVQRAGTAVADMVSQTFRGTSSLIAGVEGAFQDVGGAVRESLIGVTESLNPLTVDGLSELLAPLWSLITGLSSETQDPTAQATLADMDAISRGDWSPEVFKRLYGDRWTDHARKNSFLENTYRVAVMGLTVAHLHKRLADIELDKAAQNYNVANPWKAFSTGEAIQAYQAGEIDKDTAKLSIQATGLRDEKAEVVINSSFSPGSVGEILAAWRRNIITEDEADKAMFKLGILPVWAIRLRQLSEIIPPVQDLITMAVRETFTPDIAQKFGQFEDFPPQFGMWAEKQGLSEEWAQRYWAAHWSLPSPSQGFEMYQRAIIDRGELDTLLRALDIMPFWREKMTQLAFNPLTRVDVRRMFNLGILDADQVYEAYRQIGYDAVNAQHLTDFTVKAADHGDAQSDQELDKLTRANIITFYRDGIIPRDRAAELLNTVGVGANAAELYLTDADHREELETRKAEIDLVLATAEAGTLSFEEAEDKLNGLGLETVEVQKALSKLVKAQARKTKLPTQDDAAKFYEAGVITEDMYRDTLSRLGFNPVWVEAYVLYSKPRRQGATKPS